MIICEWNWSLMKVFVGSSIYSNRLEVYFFN